jgi:hypothetical protein|tara:strand:- start:373 stop:774 length:402 start_codon:yes stop_codon:yes gene_type:complete
MATNSNWTVIFDDKKVIKNNGAEAGTGYVIDDSSFWSESKFSNIWAIQHGTSVTSDEVEYRDTTPHTSYEDANLGDISQFITKWDAHHLSVLQSEWDSDVIYTYNEDGTIASTESESDQISRKGSRPTSYTSS